MQRFKVDYLNIHETSEKLNISTHFALLMGAHLPPLNAKNICQDIDAKI